MGSTTSSAPDASPHIPGPDLLVFGRGNGKLDSAIDHFSIPAGWSCPGARECLARAAEVEGSWKVEDGPDVQFRCFSASEEARYPNVRRIRWHNFDTLRRYAGKGSVESQARRMAALILASLPVRERVFGLAIGGQVYKQIIRLHVGGDFFSLAYLDAWCLVLRSRPDVLAYGYTKSLPFWARRLDALPDNLVLTASEGGRHDHLIARHGLRFARVVFSEAEAAALGLDIDTDDSHAMRAGSSFALLLHGPQPRGTRAAEAWAVIHASGGGHGKASARRRREAARRSPLPMAG